MAVRAAQVALGALFLASGALKSTNRGWRRQAAEFGVPRAVVWLLPWAELALGGLLMAGAGLPWTALAALVLLLVFTAAVARRLAQGRVVPCGCFGELRPRPIGAHTLIRNAALVVLAAIAAA